MRTGGILDNLNQPAESSYRKLVLMRADAVCTLFTPGTRHRRSVYERCEYDLRKPSYIVRVGGPPQTSGEWLQDARGALAEVPDAALVEDRVLLVLGNEGNIEFGDAARYGQLYAAVRDGSVPVAFACPSLGVEGWAEWLVKALAAAGERPRYGIVNLYAHHVGRVGDFIGMFDHLYVGEVNSNPWVRGAERVAFLADAYKGYALVGVEAAVVFIVGGVSHGAWDEGFVISMEEAEGIGGIVLDEGEQQTMDKFTALMVDMWQRQGVTVNPEDGFFKKAVQSAREDGVFVIPQPSRDGNFTTDVEGYRVAYTFPPMFCQIGDWSNVEVGLPPL